MTTKDPTIIDRGEYLRGLKKRSPTGCATRVKEPHERIQDRRRCTMTGWRARTGWFRWPWPMELSRLPGQRSGTDKLPPEQHAASSFPTLIPSAVPE